MKHQLTIHSCGLIRWREEIPGGRVGCGGCGRERELRFGSSAKWILGLDALEKGFGCFTIGNVDVDALIFGCFIEGI